MSIRYYKLFDLLNRRGMKKSDLRSILSPTTVAKLSKGEYISGEAIEKICRFLDCQPGDIMEFIRDPEDMTEEETKRLSDKAIKKAMPGIPIPTRKIKSYLIEEE